MTDATVRQPLAEASANVEGAGMVSSSSVRFAEDTKSKSSLSKVASFSTSGSAMPSAVVAEQLIMRGTKKKPVAGQTINGFFQTLTHLNLSGMRLTGDVAAITPCSLLRVLYVYDNRLTSLRGLGGLNRLTHLYAQDNRIENLDDFEAPPGLTQLHLTANKLCIIGGLEGCTGLTELHIGGQKPPETLTLASPVSSGSGSPELEPLPEQPEDSEHAEGKAAAEEPNADDGYRYGTPPLGIEPASLMAIAPTLRKLVASGGRIDDDNLEPFVMLQNLTSLDVRANNLESIGRLQQLLLRMPVLSSLTIRDNPLMDAPKLRERIIVASPSLAELDGKPIKHNERAFLEQLAHRQSSAGGSRHASVGGSSGGSRIESANRGRPQQLGVSIPSAQSFDLGHKAGVLIGEPPAGFYDDEHRPVSMTLQKGTARPWGRAPHAA